MKGILFVPTTNKIVACWNLKTEPIYFKLMVLKITGSFSVDQIGKSIVSADKSESNHLFTYYTDLQLVGILKGISCYHGTLS